jgi:hypothetical protein
MTREEITAYALAHSVPSSGRCLLCGTRDGVRHFTTPGIDPVPAVRPAHANRWRNVEPTEPQLMANTRIAARP